ncbi:cytochrome P450 [Nocardiopsis mwathae]|uniref:Cytochrome P450 n=1 Tax=Nocardiopsis mwathae TaxID=1472723 RepID=A0A7X0D591_9ACTN|nr:cytochrome P450 [Nocardiopsis mwathae]MBB6171501.1 cytochrome P450 [Nocardiopsis mwathae]
MALASLASLGSVPAARGRIPLAGHTVPLWRRPLAFLASQRPKGGMVRVDVGPLPVYLVTDPELAYEVLVTKAASLGRGRLYERLRPVLGLGLAMSDGGEHRRQRRLVRAALRGVPPARYTEISAHHAEELTSAWRTAEMVRVDEAMFDLVLGILLEAAFSSGLGRAAAAEIRFSTRVVAKGVLGRAITPRLLDRLPNPPHQRYDAAAARLRFVVDTLIEDRRADDGGFDDLLSLLMAARDPETGAGMTDDRIRDELVTLLMAGTEQAAATLAWSFHELARHPEVADRLREEVDRVLDGRPCAPGDPPRLAYTQRVLNEVVRLHAAPLLPRRTCSPVKIGGMHVPEGTELAVSPYAMHRNPWLFPYPERLDPDRWVSTEGSRILPRGAFLPFGDGGRRCVGDAIAWTVMTVAVAAVCSRWRLRPAGWHRVREVPAAVPRPDALPMIVENR